jgi:L-lactate utilization protein LutB
VYVVADVPEANEMGTFWEKLWTEKIKHIVLVDGGRQQKILKNYWPEESQVIRCNNIFIHCAVENVFADHKYRKFTVTYKNEIRLASTNTPSVVPSTSVSSRSTNFILLLGAKETNVL